MIALISILANGEFVSLRNLIEKSLNEIMRIAADWSSFILIIFFSLLLFNCFFFSIQYPEWSVLRLFEQNGYSSINLLHLFQFYLQVQSSFVLNGGYRFYLAKTIENVILMKQNIRVYYYLVLVSKYVILVFRCKLNIKLTYTYVYIILLFHGI